MEDIISIGHAKFWTDCNKIIYFQFNDNQPHYNLDLKTVKRYIDVVAKLCNETPMSFIIDVRGFRGTFSTEAANFLAKSSVLIKLRISEAFITNSIGTKLLIASYKRIYDPNTPHLICNEIGTARQYCLQPKHTFYGSY